MLTLRTLFTIAILHSISQSDFNFCDSYSYPPEELLHLLQELDDKGFIHLLPEHPAGVLSSYQLTRDYNTLNLMEVLEAIGEGIYLNSPSNVDFYANYGHAARRLGIVNQMSRLYLSEILLTEIPVINPSSVCY